MRVVAAATTNLDVARRRPAILERDMIERQVSLLRGINVGRANRITMSNLRAIYEQLGCRDVTTYVQSGNVILSSSHAPAELSRRAEIALELHHGLKLRILGRTRVELIRIVAANPYPAAQDTQHHVVFLSGPVQAAGLASLGRLAAEDEEFTLAGGELHLLQPNGMGRSKLGQALTERNLGVVATARNWRTMLQLVELTDPAS
jgi:uncharacterized protein (DUF1697 family)